MGYSEIFFILLVVLLIFGPEKMPEMARNMGKAVRQLRDATNGIKRDMIKETQKAGLDQEAIDKLKKELKQAKKVMNVKEEITNTIKREL